ALNYFFAIKLIARFKFSVLTFVFIIVLIIIMVMTMVVTFVDIEIPRNSFLRNFTLKITRKADKFKCLVLEELLNIFYGLFFFLRFRFMFKADKALCRSLDF